MSFIPLSPMVVPHTLMSVCSPLNPGIVNRSSVTAGSAGLQAEMLKDARHAASVEGVGGVFSPLVVDAPFAQKTLQQIAARTTVQNGLPAEWSSCRGGLSQPHPATISEVVVFQCQEAVVPPIVDAFSP